MHRNLIFLAVTLIVVFLGWRFIRLMQIFVISPAFELPIDTGRGEQYFETVAEMSVSDVASLHCVNCHMPLVNRRHALYTPWYSRSSFEFASSCF